MHDGGMHDPEAVTSDEPVRRGLDDGVPHRLRVVAWTIQRDVAAIGRRTETAPLLAERAHHAEPSDGAAIQRVAVHLGFECGELGERIIESRPCPDPAKPTERSPLAVIAPTIHLDDVEGEAERQRAGRVACFVANAIASDGVEVSGIDESYLRHHGSGGPKRPVRM